MSVTRLSTLDTVFLRAESWRTPMHVGAVVVVDGTGWRDDHGRIRLSELRSYVGERLALVPRLRQVVREVPLGLGRPVWVDDQRFDLSHHVRLLELPAPGDEDALLSCAEEVLLECLDRSRPLWEWAVIDGLADGRVAIVEKVHHALIDGISGVQIMGAMSDLVDGAMSDLVDGAMSDLVDGAMSDLVDRADLGWQPAPVPSDLTLVAGAVAEAAREPWRTATDLVRLGRRHTAGVVARVVWPHAESAALRTQPVGTHRTLRPVVLPLDEVKAIGKATATKVNDVVLTVVAGGLRGLLTHRGLPPEHHPVHALVPENLRSDDDHLTLGNRVGGMVTSLEVEEPDHVRRLQAIHATVCAQRAQRQGEAVADVLDAADHLPPATAWLAAKLIDDQPYVSTVITNVPGPREPLSIMGARVERMVPVVPLAGKITLSAAVLSYCNDLTIALHADTDAHPDLDVMVEAMRHTFDHLTRQTRRASSTRLI